MRCGNIVALGDSAGADAFLPFRQLVSYPAARGSTFTAGIISRVCTVDGGVFAALLGAVRLLSIWCLSVGVEQGAFGRAVGEVRKSVVSELT